MGKNEKVRHLTVFLLKPGCESYRETLRDPGKTTSHELMPELGIRGSFYIETDRRRTPAWVEFVQEGLKTELKPIRNVSSAGVLFVSAHRRVFAFTFGYGRTLLKDDVYERDFGLKVALNTVDPDKLRSIDTKTFEDMTLHTRKQSSRASGLDMFGLDIGRDVLRAVTGEPRDRRFARRVSGADALVMSVTLGFGDLADKCSELLSAYRSPKYRDRFGWVDHLRPVMSRQTVDALDSKLMEAIRSGQSGTLHLAPPDMVDWGVTGGFNYSSENETAAPHVELEFKDYTQSVGDLAKLTLDSLKRAHVLVRQEEVQQKVRRWSVHRCIVFETKHAGRLYVLNDGQWYRVAANLVRDVDATLNRLSARALRLPNAIRNQREGDYNEASCKVSKGQLALLDCVRLRPRQDQSQVEMCDLLSRKGHLVHVKWRTRSSTLSHLFSQGSVAAEVFLRDQDYRKDARAHLSKEFPAFADLIPVARPDPSKYTVTFAIISERSQGWPLSLPFFSRLNLKQASQRLSLLGFGCSLTRIGVAGARDK